MGKNTWEKLKTNEEKIKYAQETIASYNKSIADYKAQVVKWQNKLTEILKEEETKKRTIVRSKSVGNLGNNLKL